jgi:hypothetical protein
MIIVKRNCASRQPEFPLFAEIARRSQRISVRPQLLGRVGLMRRYQMSKLKGLMCMYLFG